MDEVFSIEGWINNSCDINQRWRTPVGLELDRTGNPFIWPMLDSWLTRLDVFRGGMGLSEPVPLYIKTSWIFPGVSRTSCYKAKLRGITFFRKAHKRSNGLYGLRNALLSSPHYTSRPDLLQSLNVLKPLGNGCYRLCLGHTRLHLTSALIPVLTNYS
jgi:hypothetical protein